MIGLSLLVFNFTACKDADRNEEQEINGETPGRDAEVIEEDLQELRGENGDVLLTVMGDPELSTFAARLDAAMVSDSLEEGEPYTIFAPSNTAYSLVYQEQGRDMLNVDFQDVVLYHVIPGEFDLNKLRREIELAEGTYNLTTLQGEDLKVTREEGKLWLEGATGTRATISETMTASNGVVHVIDAVLIPMEIDTEVELTVEE